MKYGSKLPDPSIVMGGLAKAALLMKAVAAGIDAFTEVYSKGSPLVQTGKHTKESNKGDEL